MSDEKLGTKRLRDGVGKESNKWICVSCTFHNHEALSVCEICETKKTIILSNLTTSSSSTSSFLQQPGITSGPSLSQTTSSPNKKKLRTTNNSNKNQKLIIDIFESPTNLTMGTAQSANIYNQSQYGQGGPIVIELDLDGHSPLRHKQEQVMMQPQPAVFNPQSNNNRFLLEVISDVMQQEARHFSVSYPYPHHITQLNKYGSNWSCGYRNIQMLCSSLIQIPSYRRVLFHGEFSHLTNPSEAAAAVRAMSIEQLQYWIELAWQAGFDAEGASEFNYSLIGKDNWIGTTECAALLRFFGVRAMIVDFHGHETPSSQEVQRQRQSLLKGNYTTGDKEEEEGEEDETPAFVAEAYHPRGEEEEGEEGEEEEEERDQDREDQELFGFKRKSNHRKEDEEYFPETTTTTTTLLHNEGLNTQEQDARRRSSRPQTVASTTTSSIRSSSKKATKKNTGTTAKSSLVPPLHDMGRRLARFAQEYFTHEYPAFTTITTTSSSSSASSSSIANEDTYGVHAPLYFQYMGHSRTIVGVEYTSPATSTTVTASVGAKPTSLDTFLGLSTTNTTTNNTTTTTTTTAVTRVDEQGKEPPVEYLLIFDPISKSNVLQNHLLGKPTSASTTAAGNAAGNPTNAAKINKNWQRMVKKTPHTMRRFCAHQICFVAPGLMSVGSAEYERSKVLRGIMDETFTRPSFTWPTSF